MTPLCLGVALLSAGTSDAWNPSKTSSKRLIWVDFKQQLFASSSNAGVYDVLSFFCENLLLNRAAPTCFRAPRDPLNASRGADVLPYAPPRPSPPTWGPTARSSTTNHSPTHPREWRTTLRAKKTTPPTMQQLTSIAHSGGQGSHTQKKLKTQSVPVFARPPVMIQQRCFWRTTHGCFLFVCAIVLFFSFFKEWFPNWKWKPVWSFSDRKFCYARLCTNCMFFCFNDW